VTERQAEAVGKKKGWRDGAPLQCILGKLSCFVANGSANFLGEVCWQFGHAMLFASMFCALLQNFLLSLALSYEIAVNANLSTADYL
jgi:hypothetical protein